MTVRLTVRTATWRAHVASVAASVPGLVPVVKGNGYGFGRARLAEFAAEFADTIAVGTVFELDGLPAGIRPVVLTPFVGSFAEMAWVERLVGEHRPVLTVGSARHVELLADSRWRGPVIAKLASPMRRYGADPTLVDTVRQAGFDVAGVAIHPPLAGTDDERRSGIEALLVDVDPACEVWLSHLDPATYAGLPDTHRYRLRLGTSLWHGDKSSLHLGADVVDVRAVRAGQTAGYRLGVVPGDGHLVMIGAGTAHGVTPLPDGRSPFHFARRRLALHEPPHMHTSMAFVPAGDPLPDVGDAVDLQRPLHMTTVDDYAWT